MFFANAHRSLMILSLAAAACAVDIPTWERPEAMPAGADARGMQVLDMNGDGRTDVVVFDALAMSVRVHYNQGDGVFANAVDIGGPMTAPRLSGVGDLDNDGDTDLVVVTHPSTTDVLVFLRNDGGGNWTQVGTAGVATGFDIQDIRTDKITNSTFSDVVLCGYNAADHSSPGIVVVPNSGAFSFGTAQVTALPAGSDPTTVGSGQLDSGTTTDLFVALKGLGIVAVLLNNGTGTLTQAPGSPFAAGAGARFLQSIGAPVTRVLCANESADTVSVFTTSTNGALTLSTTVALPAGTAPRQFRGADLDSDGDQDFVVLGVGNRLSTILNKGSGAFEWTGTLVDGLVAPGTHRNLRISELTGDGRLDIAVLTNDGSNAAGSDSVTVWRSQVQGFATAWSAVFDVNATKPAAWGASGATARERGMAANGWIASTVSRDDNVNDPGTIMRRDPSTGIWQDLGLPSIAGGVAYNNVDLRVNVLGHVAVTRDNPKPELMAVHDGSAWIVPSTTAITQAWNVERGGARFLAGREITGALQPGFWTLGTFTSVYAAFGNQQGNVTALLGSRAVGVTALDINTGPFYPLYTDNIASPAAWSTVLPSGGSFPLSQGPITTVPVTSFERCHIADGGLFLDFQPSAQPQHAVVFQRNSDLGSSANLIHIAPLSGHDSASLEDARPDGLALLRSWSVAAGQNAGKALLFSSTFRQASEVGTRTNTAPTLQYATGLTDHGVILADGKLVVPKPTVAVVGLDTVASVPGDGLSFSVTRSGSTLVPLHVTINFGILGLTDSSTDVIIPVGQTSVVVARTLASTLAANATVSIVAAASTADADYNYRIGQRGTLTINALVGIRDFVTGFYLQCLQRSPDAGGLAGWTYALYDKAQSGVDVARGFVLSQEFINRNLNDSDFTDVLYRSFFGREPDAGGKAGWMGALAGGVLREDVLYGFITSQEFDNLCVSYGITRMSSDANSTYQVRQFVRRFYQQCLNREPDAGGITGWTAALRSGAQFGADVANGFVLSQEFINRGTTNNQFVDILYRSFFNREGDAGGVAIWQNALNGGMTRAQVVYEFVHAQEFINLCAVYGILPFPAGG